MLQKLQGCWEPTPRPFARYGEHEFNRCPLTYLTERAAGVVRDALDGWMDEATLKEKRAVPAKRMAAMRYVLELKEGIDDDRT